MPIDAAIANDLRRLISLLTELQGSTELSATQVEFLRVSIERLSRSQLFAGTARQWIGDLQSIAYAAKQTGIELRTLQRVAEAASPAVKFRGGGGMTAFAPPGYTAAGEANIGLPRRRELLEMPLGRRLREPDFAEDIGRLGGEQALEKVTESLGKYGGTLDDLQRIQVESSGNVIRWTANVSKIPGVLNQVTVTTDKWGNVLNDTQGRFRTFTGGIIRNLTKVIQWGIAVGVVYGSIRKLQEAMREAVVIQAKLADAQVATASSAEEINTVFEQGAVVARELGVSLEGVIDGYVLAFRAAGNIEDPVQRAAAAEALLRDSMLLSKLSGIDQAIALDTLVGALRQTGLELDQGVVLVDKWVAISKVANVSIGTLAESFAITATAAENVGLTLDELNGFIAAVAEVTTLSATESGNAVRAFISGFQADQAERELAKYGISIRNVNGELRAFTSVIEDIISRKDVGLISDRELAKIAEIIGGGARRGAQVNAFLENYGRVQELAAVSANANGDASDALAIKMDTLQSATQNLSNAFTELGYALGQDGGFLELSTDIVKALTWMIDRFSDLIELLGQATPGVIALSTAMFALNKSTKFQGLLDLRLLDTVSKMGLGNRIFAKLGAGTATTLGEAAGAVFGAGGGAVGGAALGLGVSALSGDLGDLKRTGSTIAGAAISQMIAGGSPIGGLIGATIVQAMYSNFIDREADLTNAWYRIFSGAYAEAQAGVREPTDPEDLNAELYRIFGGAEEIGKLFTNLAASGYSIFGGGSGRLVPTQEDIENTLLTISQIAAGEVTGPEADYLTRLMGLDALREEDKERVREISRELAAIARETFEKESATSIETPFGLRIAGIEEQFGGRANQVFEAQRAEILRDVGRGTRGVRELRGIEELGQTFSRNVSTIFTALTYGKETSADAYVNAAEIIINATDEERKILNDLANDIGQLTNAYDEAARSGEVFLAQQAGADLGPLLTQLREIFAGIESAQAYRRFEPPDRIAVAQGTTQTQIREIVAQVRVAQEAAVEAATLEPNEQQKIRDTWGDVFFQIGDDYKEFSEVFKDLNSEILNDFLKTAGILSETQLGILTPDITSDQMPQLLGNVRFFEDLISQLRPLEQETVGILFKDYVTDTLHGDMLAIQLAMQTLIDVNEEQLEGIFNIPEGMTALIPYTGKLYFSDQPIPRPGEGGQLANLAPAVYDVEQAVRDDTTAVVGKLDELKAWRLEQQLIPPEERELPTPSEEPDWSFGLKEAIENATQGPGTEMGTQLGQTFSEALTQTLPNAFTDLFNNIFGLGGERDIYAENPELRLHERFLNPLSEQGGYGAVSTQDVLAALPQSIPVTNNIKIELVNPIYLDSTQISNALYERQLTDFKDAKRVTGVLGYVVEA